MGPWEDADPFLAPGTDRQHGTAPLAGCTRQVQGQGPSTPPEPPSSGPPLIVGLPALNHSLGSSLGSSSWEVPWKPPQSCTRAGQGALGPSSCFLHPFPPQHPCSQPLSCAPSLPMPTLCFLLGEFFSGLTKYFSSERAEIRDADVLVQQPGMRLGVETWGLAMPPLMS